MDNRPVRFASDPQQFPGFSWRGYAVFSPIQEKIIMDADVTKSSAYRVLLRYHNPTKVPLTAVVAIAPSRTNTHGTIYIFRFVLGSNEYLDVEQSEKVTFEPTDEPATIEATVAGKPFLLNPGRWALSVATQQRLFLVCLFIFGQTLTLYCFL